VHILRTYQSLSNANIKARDYVSSYNQIHPNPNIRNYL